MRPLNSRDVIVNYIAGALLALLMIAAFVAAPRRQWRRRIYEEIREAANAEAAVKRLCCC